VNTGLLRGQYIGGVNIKKKGAACWGTGACNPSYSGGRDQEDHGSKLAQENSFQDPISKKWAGRVA
jgi:hypothetical protein